MRYLFDNNFSPRLVHVLRALEIDAVALRDEFPADIKDVDLFLMLTGSDWIFVTADRQIKRRSAEARALKECGVSALFLKNFWGKRDRWQQAQWLTTHWPKLDEFARKTQQPFHAEVDSRAHITQVKI